MSWCEPALAYHCVSLTPEKIKSFSPRSSHAFHQIPYILVHKDYSLLPKRALCYPTSMPFHLDGLFSRDALFPHFFKAHLKCFLFPESS